MHDVAIIGAGPAGVAAAIYLKRAGLDLVIFEKNEVGGLVRNANLVENYPGFPNGLKGMELSRKLEEHLARWDIHPIKEQVAGVEKDKYFTIITANAKYAAKNVMIATGTSPKNLGIPGEAVASGKFVFYEVIDLVPRLVPGSVCTVVGGGDAAFDYALTLAEYGAIVELCYRKEKPECLSLLEKRVKESASIHAHPCTSVTEISVDGDMITVKFRFPEKVKDLSNGNGLQGSVADRKKGTNDIWVRPDFVLIACGRVPDRELLAHGLDENTPGLYIAGDVRGGDFRQVGIAVGDALTQAMKIDHEFKRGICNDRDRSRAG